MDKNVSLPYCPGHQFRDYGSYRHDNCTYP